MFDWNLLYSKIFSFMLSIYCGFIVNSIIVNEVKFELKTSNHRFLPQALDVIPQLKAVMPLERAQMRLRIVISGKEARKLRDKVVKLASKVETEDWTGGELNLVCVHYDNIHSKYSANKIHGK